jgi:hypothetical protein
VTPTLLCSREPQEFHAGARPADIAGKTSLGEISLGETSLGKVPLARHRMINLHVPLAAADRATREAVEAAPELDPFFIVRVARPAWRRSPLPSPGRPIWCRSRRLLKRIATQWRSPINPISAARPLWRKKAR